MSLLWQDKTLGRRRPLMIGHEKKPARSQPVSPQPKFCDASAASKNCAITWNRNIQEALGVEVVFLAIFTA